MSHYQHLTTKERECIALYYRQNYSVRKIAQIIQRSPSTVSRELRRNSWSPATGAALYHPGAAEMAYKERRKRCVRKHVLDDAALRHEVHFFLGYLYWSPEQISQRLKLEGRFSVGTSTIYRALENGKLRASLHYFLRRKYKTFGKASKKHRKCFEKMIEDRPEEANNRTELGHWEGDTIIGHGHRSCIVTIVDRKSLFLVAGKCESKKVADVEPVILQQMSRIPASKRKTITFDQGPEFTRPQTLESELGMDVYFANAHAPWERGTNENTNGLLRQFYSKERGLGDVSQGEVNSVVAKLNMRPRKRLGWKTPYEVFYDEVLHFT